MDDDCEEEQVALVFLVVQYQLLVGVAARYLLIPKQELLAIDRFTSSQYIVDNKIQDKQVRGITLISFTLTMDFHSLGAELL